MKNPSHSLLSHDTTISISTFLGQHGCRYHTSSRFQGITIPSTSCSHMYIYILLQAGEKWINWEVGYYNRSSRWFWFVFGFLWRVCFDGIIRDLRQWGGHETFEEGWEKSHCVSLASGSFFNWWSEEEANCGFQILVEQSWIGRYIELRKDGVFIVIEAKRLQVTVIYEGEEVYQKSKNLESKEKTNKWSGSMCPFVNPHVVPMITHILLGLRFEVWPHPHSHKLIILQYHVESTIFIGIVTAVVLSLSYFRQH